MHYYFAIVDLLKQQDETQLEQAVFNDHEDRVGNLGDHIKQLVLQDEPSRKQLTDPQQRGLHSHLALIETELRDVFNATKAMKSGPELDRCLLKQHEEQISGLKSELTEV